MPKPSPKNNPKTSCRGFVDMLAGSFETLKRLDQRDRAGFLLGRLHGEIDNWQGRPGDALVAVIGALEAATER